MIAAALVTAFLGTIPAAEHHAQVWAAMSSAGTRAAPIELAQTGAPPEGSGRPPMVPPGPPGLPGTHGHHGPDGPFGGPMMGMPLLRGLSLSDAQQDKVFEIMHAQAPALRLREREVRQSREALFALSRSERFDDAKATALADTGARAAAQIALMRARSAAAVWQVLTPEQRKQADEMAARRGMPHDGGRGPR